MIKNRMEPMFSSAELSDGTYVAMIAFRDFNDFLKIVTETNTHG